MVNPNQVDSARRAVIKERGGIVVSIPQTCFRVVISIGRHRDSVENLQVLVFPLFILGSQKAGVVVMEL